jgi:hypothetical protein
MKSKMGASGGGGKGLKHIHHSITIWHGQLDCGIIYVAPVALQHTQDQALKWRHGHASTPFNNKLALVYSMITGS